MGVHAARLAKHAYERGGAQRQSLATGVQGIKTDREKGGGQGIGALRWGASASARHHGASAEVGGAQGGDWCCSRGVGHAERL